MNKEKFELMLDEARAAYPNHSHILTIYEKPTDYPNDYVVRLNMANKDGVQHTSCHYRASTLNEVRAAIPQGHFTCVGRAEKDDPVIVESYI